MNNIEDNKPQTLQLRRTAVDTEKAQANLYYLILHHIKTNTCLDNAERQTFIKLVDDAVLSYGNITGYLKPRKGHPIFPTTINNLAYALMECRSTMVIFSDGFRRIKMELVAVWRVFLGMCKLAFGYARAEALHMSSEVDTTYGRSTSFSFSKDSFQ